MKLKQLITIASILLLSIIAMDSRGEAAVGVLSGQVISQADQTPVVGAAVLVLGSKIGTLTDSDGRFTIRNLDIGAYSIQVSCAGIATTTRSTVNITEGKVTEIRVAMAVEQPIQQIDSLLRRNEVGKPVIDNNRSVRPDAATDQSLGARAGEVVLNGISPYAGEREAYKSIAPMPRYTPLLPPFDMFFRDYGTNGWVKTSRDRLSTFALDVDDASYNLVKQYLNQGNIPPTEAIRVEEFINHFDYGYRPPQSGKFRVFTETAESPFADGAVFLKIGIKGREIAEYNRKPLRLTFVIDVSGSMGYDNRLELVKQALHLIVQQMSASDQIGIVAFGSTAYVVLDPISGNRKGEIVRAIDRLRSGGSTFAEAGLRLGYEMADEQFERGVTNRIILCSDGVANVGRTGPEEIMREVTRIANTGITLSTFGFGMGNYNDVLLEQLAQKGNGRYAYVNNWEEARRQFVDQLMANVQVLARDVKVQVTFDPNIVQAYRLIGYENRAVADNKFRDNRTDGGEIGAGHEVTALYELRIKGKARQSQIATIDVRWKEPNQNATAELREVATFNSRSSRFESVRPELKLAVVASRFAELLKETAYSANTSYDDLHDLALQVERELPNEQTRELAELISRAQTLSYGNDYWRAEEDDRGGGNYKR
ncbi:MAG: von Willebrand factor type A domain-containing protein [candidate division Zixibacteria bacterium]|nr:von Willebrand factor type A domain-containing protein [candidate division Zixibacteria bacterium]